MMDEDNKLIEQMDGQDGIIWKSGIFMSSEMKDPFSFLIYMV